MKTTLLKPIAAATAVILVAIACKKQNPTTPINSCPTEEYCSFCFGDMLELDSNNLIAPTTYAQQVSFLIDGQLVGQVPL